MQMIRQLNLYVPIFPSSCMRKDFSLIDCMGLDGRRFRMGHNKCNQFGSWKPRHSVILICVGVSINCTSLKIIPILINWTSQNYSNPDIQSYPSINSGPIFGDGTYNQPIDRLTLLPHQETSVATNAPAERMCNSAVWAAKAWDLTSPTAPLAVQFRVGYES